MRELRVARLTVHRTPRHIYAQVIDAEGGKVLAAGFYVEKDLRSEATGNVEAAKKVGALVAERAKATGLTKLPLTAPASSITVVSSSRELQPVKTVWNSKELRAMAKDDRKEKQTKRGLIENWFR